MEMPEHQQYKDEDWKLEYDNRTSVMERWILKIRSSIWNLHNKKSTCCKSIDQVACHMKTEIGRCLVYIVKTLFRLVWIYE